MGDFRRLLRGSSLPSTEGGTTSYTPSARSRNHSGVTDESADSQATDVITPAMMVVNRRDVLQDVFSLRPVRAQEFLELELRGPLTVDGWCLNSPLAPTKVDGYIQVSGDGVNKLCSLQTMLA